MTGRSKVNKRLPNITPNRMVLDYKLFTFLSVDSDTFCARARHGHDYIVVGFIISCELESRSEQVYSIYETVLV
jgi:hypothetical protein